MRPLNVLFGCEESQALTIAFRRRGHNAYSCDLLPCSGRHPEWHLQMDFFKAMESTPWDKVVTFQPCTDLTVSGARWFKQKRDNGSQEKSIRFFFEVWKVSNASENPIGILNGGKYVKQWFPMLYEEMRDYGFPFKPTQIIQPWQFGHGETKGTCLWLRDLPKIEPTDIVEGREQRIWKMAPSVDRGKERSKTLPGIARAMAEQWSPDLGNTWNL